MGQALQLSSDARFVIVVLALFLVILSGVLCYIYFRKFRGASGSRRKRGASNDTIIAFNHHRKPPLIMLMDDDSTTSTTSGPRCKSFYGRSTLINSESESLASIKISPSRPAVFGHEMDAQGIFIRVVLTPPTPAKRKR